MSGSGGTMNGSTKSSIEANPDNAEIATNLGNSIRLLGLALQLKLGTYSSRMLGFLEEAAEALSQLAEISFKAIRQDDSNRHILPLALKHAPDETDLETRQEILEMNLFYIDRSFSQTIPLLGDDPNTDAFFAQLAQIVEFATPKYLMLYRETLTEREASFEEVSELASRIQESLDELEAMADEYKDDTPPF